MSEDLQPDGAGKPVSRRRWIDTLLGGSLVAWAAAVVYPILRYLTPPKDAGGPNKITLTDAQKQELSNMGSLITRIGTDRVIVLKKKDEKLGAFSAKCTHEGCTVQFVAGRRPHLVRLPQREVRPRRPGPLGSAAPAARGLRRGRRSEGDDHGLEAGRCRVSANPARASADDRPRPALARARRAIPDLRARRVPEPQGGPGRRALDRSGTTSAASRSSSSSSRS